MKTLNERLLMIIDRCSESIAHEYGHEMPPLERIEWLFEDHEEQLFAAYTDLLWNIEQERDV